MAETAGERKSWGDSARVYLHPRVLAMLFLGFAAGLPFLLVASTLSAWLKTAGIGIGDIGLFAAVGILYSLKFLWAPVIDGLPVPVLTRWLGRRRAWMLLSQCLLIAALLGMAWSDPTAGLTRFAVYAVLVAFASATQDIVIDAYRIEAVELKVQGAMAASYQTGYRLGLVLAGAGALFIADIVSWQAAYQAMALSMAVGIVTVLVIDEPESAESTRSGAVYAGGFGAWFSGAFIGPFVDFFQRNGRWAIVLLAFIGMYRTTDYVLGVMANPFYLDIGFSLIEIGSVTKIFGAVVVLVGAAGGGLAVARYGLGGPLVFGAVLLAVTNLFFAGMAVVGDELWFLFVTIGADNLAAGFTGTVFIAYLSGLTNAEYTATQYALFSSLMALPGKLLAVGSGFIVEAIDWFGFFVYASAMGIPGIVLAVIVVRRLQDAAK